MFSRVASSVRMCASALRKPPKLKRTGSMVRSSKHLRGEVKPSKFKTSMCQYFLKETECPFGDKCAFAHGEAELRSEQQNLTEICDVPAPPLLSASATQHPGCGAAWIESGSVESAAASPINPTLFLHTSVSNNSSCAEISFNQKLQTHEAFDDIFTASPRNHAAADMCLESCIVFRHNPYSRNGRTTTAVSPTSLRIVV